MRIDSTIRICAILFLTAVVLASAASPAAAEAGTTPPDYEYDANELLAEGSMTLNGGELTLTLDGTARESDRIRIEIDEGERSRFDIAGVTDATGGDIGVALDSTADAIEIELTDLGGDRDVTGTEIAIEVDLTATDAAAGSFDEYDSTPIASVSDDETGSGLNGENAVTVSMSGIAEIGFDADEIDETLDGSNNFLTNYSSFTLSFADRSVWVNDGETINISVNPEAVSDDHDDGIEIRNVAEKATQDDNISSIDVTTSADANVLGGNADQITVTINTADGEPKLVSGEAISLNVQLAIQTESMKSAADRYHDTDFLTVDVEDEDNTELVDNEDIKTESPVVLNIYSGEAASDGFELRGIESDAEFGIGENRTLAVDGLHDRFGNEIRRAEFEIALDGNADRYAFPGVEIDTGGTDTDGTAGVTVGNGGEIDTRVGEFDVSAEVVDVEGPATQSENTGDAVTETIERVSIYPDNVTVEPTTPYRDFDVDGATIELAVDLGVSDADIDRVDLELRRESGSGTVTFDPTSASPTDTDLWTESGYAGDEYLGQENPWAIERELTAADFDGGTRTYVLDADTADSYDIAVEVMPHEDRLVPDESEIETSMTGSADGANRDVTEIVATGAVDAVENVSVSTDQEFVGVEVDEGGPVKIDLGGFEDASGNTITNTDEAVPVRLGDVVAGTVSPTTGDSSAGVTVDPTEIDLSAVETGTDAEITIEFNSGSQRNATDLTLVHKAIERPGGTWRAASLPQPAALHVDAEGGRDVVQWNPETDAYESVATGATDDVLEAKRVEHEHLHRGLYVYSDEGDLRIGFDFTTDADEAISAGDVELEEGWHLASSNYDTSAHARRDLRDDVNWAGYGFGSDDDAFSIWNANLTDRLHDTTDGFDEDGAATSIEHDEVYWIRINDDRDTPLTRGIISPTFSEQDGIEE